MTNVLITFISLSILVLIYIVLGLILHIPGAKLKRNGLALAVCVVITVMVHVIYDVTAVAKPANDMEFYVAFIGGGVTLFIYKNIGKKSNKRE